MITAKENRNARLLTAREAAERLSICERKLWSLTVPRGRLPCVRIARSVRYSVDDLDEFIASLRSTAES